MENEVYKEMIKDLESSDPEDLVGMLGLTPEQILRAFPGHVYDYIRDNVPIDNEKSFEELERLRHEGISIYETDP